MQLWCKKQYSEKNFFNKHKENLAVHHLFYEHNVNVSHGDKNG